MRILTRLWLGVFIIAGGSVHAGDWSDSTLKEVLMTRFENDRTAPCIAAAVVEDKVSQVFICSDGKNSRGYNEQTQFEIGSVSKTMTAVVLAGLIRDGKLALDDPLKKILPDDSLIPVYEDNPILLRHMVTHTTGLPALPSGFVPTRMDDPYANVTKSMLLNSLADVTLTQPPGKNFAYSNYAMMLLSYGLGEHTGQPFEVLLNNYVFEPIGMSNSTVTQTDKAAQGHMQNGDITSEWNIPPAFSGVGGVRASLPDMIGYVKANLGITKTKANTDLLLTHQPVTTDSERPMGMNWFISEVGGKKLLLHEGGTGGFSTFVGFDKENQTGVILLSDTSLTAVGGLGTVGLHLLNTGTEPGKPRVATNPSQQLLDDLVGEYVLSNGLPMTFSQKDGALYVQAQGQPKFELGYDSAGDFYPLAFDALATPAKTHDGSYDIRWSQGGGILMATRQDKSEFAEFKDNVLSDYRGRYPLLPGFALDVFVDDNALFVQGTGQPALPVTASAKDEFWQTQVNAKIVFARDSRGKVASLTLFQAGQELKGNRETLPE